MHIFPGANMVAHDLKVSFIISLHMEAPFLSFVLHINLVKLEPDAVHGMKAKLDAVQLDIKIDDHAANLKISGLGGLSAYHKTNGPSDLHSRMTKQLSMPPILPRLLICCMIKLK